ncbi:phosphatidate cytidylyltransferase [Breoghania sp.]|uniref:phosphatidate cytidylyltransferase n=1 Tax=Breoghania sp. TaxID=2065378 RepID=UPI00263540D2|nr:phosphatidate cytidylyltransferase [Breoghania sp.]MDJ0929683.1 phosphatidate cytidylyltransferase [Breoghania sp.]
MSWKGTPANALEAPKGHSNLFMRVLSSVILAPVFLFVVWYGGALFHLVLLAAALLILNEWVRITRSVDFVAVFAGFGLAAAAGAVWWSTNFYAVMIVIDTVIVVGMLSVLSGPPPWSALGVLYAGLPMVALTELRLGENGLWAVAVILALTWATDIAAYFAGKVIGGRKLWPAVSPKKTWSGAIGGLIGGGVAGCAVSLVSGIGTPVTICIVAVVFSIASQLGDLAESALKRHFGVKDSGTLIPGHGGIMDRADGLVAAAIAAYIVGLIASGGSNPSLGLALL